MQTGQPSRTALAAATHRAAHQLLDGGSIFNDPLAVRILGEDPATIVREANEQPQRRRMRLFIAVRHRFAEDSLAAACARGLRQLVVLGAGLDTLAYRSQISGHLRIFEVDHPATQAWKRERLAAAGIAVPACLAFAPVDFERQTLSEGLAAAGFDTREQAFFTWLGVVPYLTSEAIWSTLSLIGSLPARAQVVFDYGDPPELLPAELREWHGRGAAHVEALGEKWLTYFDPPVLHVKLRALGFTEITDLGPPKIRARFLPGAPGAAPERGGHVLLAVTGANA